jgi:hypothetical protein
MLEQDVNIIEDDFLDTDVTELVVGDYYLFHITDTNIYIYKDGVITVHGIDDVLDVQNNQHISSFEYTKGTLREFVNSL